ncbi:hypothetical protein GCM10010191_31320 [Actinomadura vinacea]|uniref:Uncharacterized protein n=1 Tax=Actinomadura vinacea TaxID=115336 RepID=A0ABN3J1D6_9ACTN
MSTLNSLSMTTAASDDADEEAARALQTALDRRDNGGRPAS